MKLYTALTRARNQLYLIEVADQTKSKRKGTSLADFAFRRLSELKLAKKVDSIDEGQIEMSPAQHKARGVLLVTQALNMNRNQVELGDVKEKFRHAKDRFSPDMGNDKELFDKCEKHLNAIEQTNKLKRIARDSFFVEKKHRYCLENRFSEVLAFERDLGQFFAAFLCDPFMAEEVAEVRKLVEEVFFGTPYEVRLRDIIHNIEHLGAP